MLRRAPPVDRYRRAAHRVHDVVHNQVVLVDLPDDVPAAVNPVQARRRAGLAERPVVADPHVRSSVQARDQMVLPDHGRARRNVGGRGGPPLQHGHAGGRDVGQVQEGQFRQRGRDLGVQPPV
jgi:hypothetical protein